MENNGRGIFYGVIGVATLVVAIIGATFAYFSAQGTGNTFQTSGAKVGVSLTDDYAGYKANLIPVKTTGGEGAKLQSVANTRDCVDYNNYNVCSVYTYTITNTSVESEGGIAQTFYATIDPSQFTFISGTDVKPEENKTQNFNIAIFKGSSVGDVESGEQPVTSATDGQLVYKDVVKSDEVFSIPELTITLDPIGDGNVNSHTYTVLMWIEETGYPQDYDQGAIFAGSIKYATSGGGNLTGALTAAAE